MTSWMSEPQELKGRSGLSLTPDLELLGSHLGLSSWSFQQPTYFAAARCSDSRPVSASHVRPDQNLCLPAYVQL